MEDVMEHSSRKSKSNQTNIPDDVLERMETAFHADFAEVRVTESAAPAEIGAVALAQGTEIQFAPGRYQPQSAEGQAVLGHELAHVIQHHEGRAEGAHAKGLSVAIDAHLEDEADALGERAARGEQVASRAEPVRRPARSSSGAVRAMFEPGAVYKVIKRVSDLDVGDIVTLSKERSHGFEVRRQSDGELFRVKTEKATTTYFEKLAVKPGDADYVPLLPQARPVHYEKQPKPDMTPAKQVKKKNRDKTERSTYKSSFTSTKVSAVNFDDTHVPQELFSGQKSTDRAAITLLDEGLEDGTAFTDKVTNELTGEDETRGFVANAYTGHFKSLADSDKDHVRGQDKLMGQLVAMEDHANQGEFQADQVNQVLQAAGSQLVHRKDGSFAMPRSFVNAQFNNPDNLVFAGKGFNQQQKNAKDELDLVKQGALHPNLAPNYDGTSMVGSDGRTLAKAMKDNLKEPDNAEHLQRTAEICKMNNSASSRATKVRTHKRKASDARDNDDLRQAEELDATAENRANKLHLQIDTFKAIDMACESDDESNRELRERVPMNVKSTIDGHHAGQETNISVLQQQVATHTENFDSLKSQFETMEDELTESQTKNKKAKTQVAYLKQQLDASKEETAEHRERAEQAEERIEQLTQQVTELQQEVLRLKAQLAGPQKAPPKNQFSSGSR
jgi:hypothetical protein